MYPIKGIEKYDSSMFDKLSHRYTTLYSWNYISWDFNEWVWSHPWVDIIPPKKNSDVLCVLDWNVYKIWEDWAYWKYIIIKHSGVPDPDNFNLSTNLYSCYLHLSEITVSNGDDLVEGYVIWKTWSTWMSSWEHLHFQIDREESPYHSYWPYTWLETQKLWIWFLEWVNKKVWYDNLLKYTVNPLVYLDKISNYKFDDKINNFDTTIKTNEINNNDLVIDSNKDTENNKVLNTNNDDLDITNDLNSLLSIWLEKNEKKESFIEIIWVDSDIELASIDNTIINNIWINENETLLEWKNNNFSDINSDHPYFSYILWLKNKWLLSWYSDNTYRGNSFVTRAELLKIIFNITGTTLSNVSKNFFKDIDTNSWVKKYVNTWVELWLISTNNSLFRPNENISRSEALKIIIRLLWIDISTWISCEYTDVKWTEWYAKYVDISCKYNLIPWNKTHFYPNKSLTRYELIWIFYNYEINKAI